MNVYRSRNAGKRREWDKPMGRGKLIKAWETGGTVRHKKPRWGCGMWVMVAVAVVVCCGLMGSCGKVFG
jgi:hypothetical protein